MDDTALKNNLACEILDASGNRATHAIADESRDIEKPFVSENTTCDKAQTSARRKNRRYRGDRKASDVQGAHAQSDKDDAVGRPDHPGSLRSTRPKQDTDEGTTIKETTNQRDRRCRGGNRKVKQASCNEDVKLLKTEHAWKATCLQLKDQTESDTFPLGTLYKSTKESHDDNQNEIPVSRDECLHKAKHPWKPKCLEQIEYTEEEKLFMSIRGLLNKLTPHKFQRTIALLQTLHIDSEQKLHGFVDLIFEKAISEHLYSSVYANACRCLSMIKVKSAHKEGKMVNFRALLLERCQKNLRVCTFAEVTQEDLDELENENERSKLLRQIEERNYKMKNKLLGTVRFVGELFQMKLLTPNIIHDLIFKLLKAKDNTALECVCVLWTTVGKELDVEKSKRRIDQYFQQMSKITNDKKRLGRIKWLLINVIDLRKNQWIPPRPENNPKPLD